MSRTKRFVRNSVSAAWLQIVVFVSGLITPKIMLSYYGSEINGLVSSITQFISYFDLVTAGLAGAGIYALYKPLANKNYDEINRIVSASKKMYIRSGYIFLSLITILALAYPIMVKTTLLSNIEVGILVFILGADGVANMFSLSKYNVLLSADQKNSVITTVTSIRQIITVFLIVFLARAGVGIVFLRLSIVSTILLRSIVLASYCKKHYKFLDFKAEPNFKALDKRWDALFQQLLGVIQTGAPVVLLTLLVKDLKVVSVYSVFNMVILGISGLLSIFTSGLSASFGEVIARKEIDTLQKAYREFEFAYYWLITIIYSTTFITIMSFVNIYTKGITDINYSRPVVGFLFVLNALLFNIKIPQGMLVMSAGMYRETRWRAAFQALIVVVLGAFLTPRFGLTGVLVALIAANLYRAVDLFIFIPKYVTLLPVSESLKRVLTMAIEIGAVFIIARLVSFTPKNYFMWIVYATACVVLSALITLVGAIILERNELTDVLKRTRTVIRR